jgi:hypothetical protein
MFMMKRRHYLLIFCNKIVLISVLAAASDKVYQLLAHGRWFSPASSITKSGRHDIAEMLLKVALSTINQITDICEQHRLTKYI